MLISVTFPQGKAGPLALVRMKRAGEAPEYRAMPIAGDLSENLTGLLAFIWEHVQVPHVRQGWLWEA